MDLLPSMPRTIGPSRFLDRRQSWSVTDVYHSTQESIGEREVLRPRLCCYQCKHAVTDDAASLDLMGGRVHVFTNPAGICYEIALYQYADCVTSGPATTEYTWFAGYAWQLALCANCALHLGWRYHQIGATSFYGLIRDRLIKINPS